MMINEVYLDNSATTKPYNEVIEIMTEILSDKYGNPSSLHVKGLEAEREIKKARQIISSGLNTASEEIYFTSGGTEANNISIIGAARLNRKKGNHLITSRIEHPSVLNVFKYLEEEGFDVSYIDVDKNGIIDIEQFKSKLSDDTILVSLMYVNNEIGTIQPIEKVGSIIKNMNPSVLYHVDAVQAYGKTDINISKCKIDLMSFSAHKLHGPKGVGAVYIKKGSNLKPLIYGGGQELNIRSGTENVPGIVGFGKAVQKTFNNMHEDITKINKLKTYMKNEIIKNILDIRLNGSNDENDAPHILNVSFRGIKSEVLVHAMGSEGIFVSSGSACSSKNNKTSHVLEAIGVSEDEAEGSIRFSFSCMNTLKDVEDCINVLIPSIKKLRKFTRR
jgi:cysteine desulfurase